uniref:Beta-catenin-interacting protein 1 n=30 Tax=Eutheria TaxID=9347 RepID=G3TMY4_LOXAF
ALPGTGRRTPRPGPAVPPVGRVGGPGKTRVLCFHRAAPSYFSLAAALPSQLSTCLPEVNFQKQGSPALGRGMNREGAPGKSPEEMYIQQKVRVLLMLRKMGSNLTASEEEFLRTYAGVVNSQLSQLPQHSIDQGAEDVVMAFSRSETEDRRQ